VLAPGTTLPSSPNPSLSKFLSSINPLHVARERTCHETHTPLFTSRSTQSRADRPLRRPVSRTCPSCTGGRPWRARGTCGAFPSTLPYNLGTLPSHLCTWTRGPAEIRPRLRTQMTGAACRSPRLLPATHTSNRLTTHPWLQPAPPPPILRTWCRRGNASRSRRHGEEWHVMRTEQKLGPRSVGVRVFWRVQKSFGGEEATS
jgi:hypothetical protein